MTIEEKKATYQKDIGAVIPAMNSRSEEEYLNHNPEGSGAPTHSGLRRSLFAASAVKVDRLRFMHIPKTAGVSFYDCLERIYPGEHFLFTPDTAADLERYASFDPLTRRQIVLFGGHTPKTIGENEIDALPVITMLRDPVSRVKSFCQHIREGKAPPLKDRFPPETFNLDVFLNSGLERLENLQTKMLLGRGNFRTFKVPDMEPGLLAERAIDVLANGLVCFGVMERFDESLMLFKHHLGWGWPVYHRLNARDESRLLTFEERHIEKIRELNSVDIRVYTAALPIFQERLEAADVTFALFQFRFRQRLFQMRHEPRPRADKIRRSGTATRA